MNSLKSVFVLALTLSACLSGWWSSAAIAGNVFGRVLHSNEVEAEDEERPTDLLDLPTEVLLMKIAPLLGNRSELHSLACTSQGFLYKLHMRPGHERHSWFEGVVQSLPGFRKTKTGAVYTKVLNHPKLGTAWKDPRGLLWSDRYMRSPDGEILELVWDDAREHCFNLNGDPARIEEVKERYQAREDHMTAMRGQLERTFTQRGAANTRLYGELIRRSQEFGAIAGCYLPSREELANHGVDLGFGGGDSRFSPQVFTEYERRGLWSGSANPIFGRSASFFSGRYGDVDNGGSTFSLAFRCVCSP